MGRPSTIEPETSFGRWLVDEMERRGLIKKALRARSGVGQSTISQIVSGARHPSRDMVQRLAEGLAGNEMTLEAKQAIVDSGLRAAGYAPTEYHYPEHRPLHSIIRDIGIDEKQFTANDMEQLQHSVEAVIEGYAVKKQRQKQAQK